MQQKDSSFFRHLLTENRRSAQQVAETLFGSHTLSLSPTFHGQSQSQCGRGMYSTHPEQEKEQMNEYNRPHNWINGDHT